jgi:hypothetical protein
LLRLRPRLSRRSSFENRDYRSSISIFAHELFHLFDRHHEGKERADLEWSGLNDDAFHYGDGMTLYPGFTSRYGQRNVWEDKATLYAIVMSDSMMLCELHRKDAIIGAKVRLLRTRLANALGAENVAAIGRRTACFEP